MRAYGIVNDEERQHFLTCYHETGHAIAAFWRGIPVEEISVVETDDAMGCTTTSDHLEGRFEFFRSEVVQAMAGPVAECFAWDMANGIDTIARKVFLRLVVLQHRGQQWFLDDDIDRAIDCWRFANPRKSVKSLFYDLTDLAADCFELLWRSEYELHDVADKLFRRASGIIQGDEFKKISKAWQHLNPPEGIWHDCAFDIAFDFVETGAISSKPLPPRRAKPRSKKKAKRSL